MTDDLTDWWVRFLGGDRAMRLDLDLGPLSLHLDGRAVFFLYVTATLLLLSGLAVWRAGTPEVRRRWSTWVLIAPIVGVPIWLGQHTTTVLAVLLAGQAVREFAALVQLPRPERILLFVLAVGYPLAAWLQPGWLQLAPVIALLCAVPALVAGDTERGMERAAYTAFASIWLCWAIAHLVVLWENAFLLIFAAAAADVAAWTGGKGLRRFTWARRPLSPLSPNKTVGGLVGALLGAVLVLALLGTITIGLVIAVGLGGVAGDLLESMVKRRAGVKDAGAWLPGFGGLLDRIDSLLIVLPLAAVLG